MNTWINPTPENVAEMLTSDDEAREIAAHLGALADLAEAAQAEQSGGAT